MIKSIEALTGGGKCLEAIMIQQRPRWVYVAYILVIDVALLVGLMAEPTISEALAIEPELRTPVLLLFWLCSFLAALIFYQILTSYWVLARCGSEVILARSSKFSAKAIQVVDSSPAPRVVEIKGTIITDKVLLGGEQFYMARLFRSRLRRIVNL